MAIKCMQINIDNRTGPQANDVQ